MVAAVPPGTLTVSAWVLCGAQKDLTASWQMYSKKYERWQRQMHTSYADLSEEEKGSDVEVVKEHYPQLMEALNKLDEEAQR